MQLQFTPPVEGLGSVIEPGALAIDIDIVIAIIKARKIMDRTVVSNREYVF